MLQEADENDPTIVREMPAGMKGCRIGERHSKGS